MKSAVVLVGHGAPPSNVRPGLVERLKRLEGERRRSGTPPSDEERALDREIREIPRTADNDPYSAGIEALAIALRSAVRRHVVAAYNEFCAPGVEQAVEGLVRDGITDITVVTTMMTPGGVHAAVEIPETLEALRRAHPQANIVYVWPFDVNRVAALLADSILAARGADF